MATKIVTKNSSTASAVPTASDLVQGELAVNVADKRLFTEDNAGAIVELGTNPSTLTVTGEITANGGIALGDNDKATFGAGDDLQIYHDGSHSYVGDFGTGNLSVTGNNLYLQNTSGETYLSGISDGAVSLYHNNAAKLATTSTGIDVTGTATMDGLTVSGSVAAGAVVATISNSGANGAAQLYLNNDAQNWIVNTRVDDAFSIYNATSNKTPFLINTNGDISFYEDTGTTAKLFWDASAESLGIGTASPFYTAANRSAVSINGTSSSILGFGIGDSPTAYLLSDAGGLTVANTSATLPTLFYTNSAERMRIDSSGRVGIGTASPNTGYALDVSGAIPAVMTSTSTVTSPMYGGLGVKRETNTNGNGTGIGFLLEDAGDVETEYAYIGGIIESNTAGSEDGGLVIATTLNNVRTQRMRIDSSGNVGIGVSTPSNNHANANNLVVGNGTAGGIANYVGTGTGWYAFSRANANNSDAYDGGISYDGSRNLMFHTNAGTERMRIDSSGNLLVGTTSSAQDSGSGVKLRLDSGQARCFLVADATTGEGFSMRAGGAYKFFVGYNGTINATSTAISGISDIRYKENIRDLDDGLAKVMQLQPRKFDWKEGKGKDIANDRGFIAQEFEEVFPDLIGEWKDPAPEGEEPYKSVSQDLIPTLVKAIQEQQTLIESLTARIAALEE